MWSEEDPRKNSGHIEKQIERLHSALAPIKDLADKGYPLLVAGDVNIDQLAINDPTARHDLKRLNSTLNIYKDYSNLQQLNYDPTRYRIGSKPSLLDLILSNQPGHVDSVETKKSVIADHCSV